MARRMRFLSSAGATLLQSTLGTTPNMAPPSRRNLPPEMKWTL